MLAVTLTTLLLHLAASPAFARPSLSTTPCTTKGREWLVELRVKNPRIKQFCYGALVSDQHIVSASDCSWLTKTAFGSGPVALLANNETRELLAEAAAYKGDGGPAVFTLASPLTGSGPTPICLPSPHDDESAGKLTFSSKCVESGETGTKVGWPHTGPGGLEGMQLGSCGIYANATAFSRWISGAIANEAVLVNDMCPVARQHGPPGDAYACTESRFPGFARVASVHVCPFESGWKLLSEAADGIRLQCRSPRGEIVVLPKSRVACNVINCFDESQPDKVKVSLETLAKKCSSDPILASKKCFPTSAQPTRLPTTNIRSDGGLLGRTKSTKLDSCLTVDGSECRFPFTHSGVYHAACIVRDGLDAAPVCPVGLGNSTTWLACSEECPLMTYHSHDELTAELERLAEQFPEHVSVFNLGRSIGGRQLAGIRLYSPEAQANPLTPMVKLVGNMHGNEPVGREMLIHMARHLLMSSTAPASVSARERNIVASTDIWILPTMNPDGFARGTESQCFGGNYRSGRYNEGRKDLNRDFPSWRDLGKSAAALEAGRQVETVLVMRWIMSKPFVLSANFHDGAILVNYPFDDYRGKPRAPKAGAISETPDNELFQHLAKSYSHVHPYMNDTSIECEHWGKFADGITNGAAWYEVSGGMQDFNYDFSNAMEITVEVSCCKYPSRSRLVPEWANNAASITNFVLQAQRGVRGHVVDSKGQPAEARIQVKRVGDAEWNDKEVVAEKSTGRYWRLLLPGRYNVRAVSASSSDLSVEHEITVGSGLESVVLDLTLQSQTTAKPSS